MNNTNHNNTDSFLVGWRQVGVCFVLLAATGMITMTYSIVSVPLAEEFKPSRTMLMMTMTVLSATSAALMPFLGNLMDRISLRITLITGGIMLGAGYAAISLTTSFNQILIIFAVLIAPANVLLGPLATTVLLSRWFVKRRGRAIGIAIAGISAGGVVFPFIIQNLLDTHDWRTTMQLLGAILSCLAISAALLAVNRPSDRGLYPDGARTEPAQAKAEQGQAPISALKILSDPAFWMIAATVAIVTSGMKGMITNLAPLVSDSGIEVARAAALVSVYASCSFIAKLSFAALSDKTGPRVLMIVALGGFAAGLACLTQAHLGYGVIALGVGLIGLLGGFMVPMESYLVPRIFGQRVVGRAMGLLSGTILVALLATPPLFGFIFDMTGSYIGIFWTFSGLAVLAIFLVPFVRLSPRENQNPVQNG